MTGGTAARTKINAHKSTQMPIVWENVREKKLVEKDRELNAKMAHPVNKIPVNTCTHLKDRSVFDTALNKFIASKKHITKKCSCHNTKEGKLLLDFTISPKN